MSSHVLQYHSLLPVLHHLILLIWIIKWSSDNIIIRLPSRNNFRLLILDFFLHIHLFQSFSINMKIFYEIANTCGHHNSQVIHLNAMLTDFSITNQWNMTHIPWRKTKFTSAWVCLFINILTFLEKISWPEKYFIRFW